jgi:peptidoglycan/LPS O-acetylase OafA/YrhL
LPVNLSNGRIVGLDGMRALSVLLVLFSHFGFEKIIPGALGVTIFFFISGFLITLLLFREFRSTGKIKILDFYARRQARLLPELLFYILVSGVLGILYIGLPRLQDYLSALFYYANYHHLFAIYTSGITDFRWPHLWSLAVEQHFYLTFPFIFAAFAPKPQRLFTFLISLCLLILIWRGIIITFGGNVRYTYEASDARIDSIAYGCITAIILWFGWNGKSINLGQKGHWFIATGVILLVATIAIRYSFFREVIRYSLQGLALMLIFLGLYGSNMGFTIIRILESAPLIWMGHMTYGAYLWHFDFLILAQHFNIESSFEIRPIYTIALALTLTSGTFIMAYISYKLIFLPSQKWLHKRKQAQVIVSESV